MLLAVVYHTSTSHGLHGRVYLLLKLRNGSFIVFGHIVNDGFQSFNYRSQVDTIGLPEHSQTSEQHCQILLLYVLPQVRLQQGLNEAVAFQMVSQAHVAYGKHNAFLQPLRIFRAEACLERFRLCSSLQVPVVSRGESFAV